jgi:hypothetical protein
MMPQDITGKNWEWNFLLGDPLRIYPVSSLASSPKTDNASAICSGVGLSPYISRKRLILGFSTSRQMSFIATVSCFPFRLINFIGTQASVTCPSLALLGRQEHFHGMATRAFRKVQMTAGLQLAWRKRVAAHITPKAKCPFPPKMEIVMNLWGETPP